MIDLNNHLLGEQGREVSLKQARENCEIARRNGIREIVVTRRFAGQQVSSFELACAMNRFEHRLNELRQSLVEAGSHQTTEPASTSAAGQMNLASGYEWGLTPDLPEKLQSLPVSPAINGGNCVLVSFPSLQSVPQAEQLFEQMEIGGWQTIIAHPECSRVLRRDGGLLNRLVKAGAMIQLDAASLLGRYGDEVEKFAITLLEQNKVSFIATRSGHGTQQISLAAACQRAARRVGKQAVHEIVSENPLKILTRPATIEKNEVAIAWQVLEPAMGR